LFEGYGGKVSSLNERVHKLKTKFNQVFENNGRKLAIGRAPGRFNLIGEHTDYNQGYVMPMALNKDVLVAAQRRTDRTLSVHSMEFNERITVPLGTLKNNPDDGWANAIKAVISALENSGHKQEGYNLVIQGDVPMGAGLSSSAALEVAVAVAIGALGGWPYEPLAAAKLCQRAENNFLGLKSGIMDPLASTMARKGQALFIDCRSLEMENLPGAFTGHGFLLVHSGRTRGLAGSAYNQRREECTQAVKLLRERNPKYDALRDVGVVAFERHKSALTPLLARRAEHVVYENDRVLKAREALRSDDAATFGALMFKSHASLRRLYEVSSDELDALIDLSLGIEGVVGARMTGGGFGGCVLLLMREEKADFVREALSREYRKKMGLAPTFIACDPAEPAGELEIETGEL
jgi:galactokinase